MTDPYAVSTVSTTSGVAPSDTNNFDGVSIGIGTLANLQGQRKHTHLRMTAYQEPGEIGSNPGGALAAIVPIISQNRMGDGSGVVGPDTRWPDSNVRITSVTAFTASGSPAYKTIQSYGIRLNDSLYQYCDDPWTPELDGVAAAIGNAHYGVTGYAVALWCIGGAADLCVICPGLPTTHPGTVVPLMGKEYPPLVASIPLRECKGPSTLRHRLVSSLFSACDSIFWCWPNGKNSAPKLAWRTRSGWLAPWWGLPPVLEVWVNDYIFTTVATVAYQMEIHLEQEIVEFVAGSWKYTQTDTIIDTVTIPLSTRWNFSGPTDVTAWALITTAATTGTLAINAIGFRYSFVTKMGGSTVSRSGCGIWSKVPPRSPNWAAPGGRGELYQTGLALQTDL